MKLIIELDDDIAKGIRGENECEVEPREIVRSFQATIADAIADSKPYEADRWISVKERLPDTDNLILLSVRHETPARTHKAVYGGYYDRKFLTVNSVAVEGCFVEGCNTIVEAWKPLPKPYESEDK